MPGHPWRGHTIAGYGVYWVKINSLACVSESYMRFQIATFIIKWPFFTVYKKNPSGKHNVPA